MHFGGASCAQGRMVLGPTSLTVPDFTLLSAWLKTEAPSATAAPKEIPIMYKDWFSMNGTVSIENMFFNQAYLGGKALQSVWTNATVSELMEKARKKERMKYWSDGLKLHDGARKYNVYIQGKRGIVVGSETPWVESLFLHYGARKILTVEFGEILSEHPQLATMVPKQFTESFLNAQIDQFDFGVSFSSLEHDGLGRYGDVLNPIGDLHSMAKMLSVIKPGGIFFIAVPTRNGEDLLVFNAHRIYGKLRLPLLMAGWNFIDIIHKPDNLDRYGTVQHLFVLQNMNGCISQLPHFADK